MPETPAMTEEKREFLTFDQAVAMLPDGDEIHTFRSNGFALLGTDWPRAQILEAIRNGKPELAGPLATSMGHGLLVHTAGVPLFIEVKK